MKEGWTYKKLGEVCEIIGGGTPDKKNSEYYDGNIPWATVRDMNCDLLVSTDYCISEIGLKNSASHLIDKGEIIIATRVGLGKVCKLAQDTAINQDLKGIIPLKDNIDRDFLFYYFKHKAKHIENSGIGATVKGVKLKFIEDLQFPIVDLDEQLTIVARLDSAFAQIDSLKSNAEKQLSEARKLFQKALEEAMTPKEGWEEKTIGEIFKTYSGGTPIKSHKEYYDNGDIPWIRSGEVCQQYITECEMFITEEGMKNSSAKYYPINTVLVAMYGATAAQVGILKFEATSNQAVCGILPNKDFVPEFIYYWFTNIQKELAAQAQGGAQPNISQEKIKRVLIPTIPLSTQQSIVAHLDALSSLVRALEAKLKKMKDECDALKQAMLREVFE